ncbi:MAG: TonB-dependent receptor [Planctomycetota bacterium]
MTHRPRCLALAALLCLARASTAEAALAPQSRAADDGADVALEELVLFEPSPPVYAASKREQQSADAPADVIVITADDIRRYGYRTVTEALRFVSGTFLSTDLDYDFIGVRGFAIPGDYNTRVLVLINGHTINSGADGSVTYETLNLHVDAIDHIEVIKGPGSVLFGNSAFFGTINIVLKDGAQLDGGILSAEVGSFERQNHGFSFGRKLGECADFFFTSNFFDFANGHLHVDELDAATSRHRTELYGATSGVRIGDLSLLGHASRGWSGSPLADYGAVFDSSHSYKRQERGFLEARYRPQLDDTKRLDARLYYDQSVYFDAYDYTPDPTFRDDVIGRWWGGELGLQWQLHPDHTLTIGAESQYVTAYNAAFERAPGGFRFERRDRFRILKLYAQDEWCISESVRIVGGAQGNLHSEFDDQVVGRAAAIIEPDQDSTLKLLVGQGFRNPSAYEAFFDDGSATIANPDLSSERVVSYEASYSRQLDRCWRGGVAVYRNEVDDALVLESVDTPQGSRQQFQNSGRFATYGVELTADAAFESGVRGFAALALQDDGAEDLINFPNVIGSANVALPIVEPVSVALRNSYVGSRHDRNGGRAVAAYLTTDLILLVQDLFARHADFSVGVYNVWDRAVGHAGGPEYVPLDLVGEGRAFAARLTVRW